MAGEWQMVRLGDYVDSNLGKMLDANKNKGVPRPYLGNSNVRWGSFELNDLALMKFEEGEEERYGIRDGDLIVCEGGEPGRCAVWREQVPDMKIQKALHRIRPKDGLNNYYLFYWFMLAGRSGWLEPFFTGTTIKHLTGKALSELKVPLPPIEEQRAIAHILGTLDDKIENLRRQNETLEAMARALFKAWFVDFDPVRAKIEGRWRRGETLPGLPAHLYDLFPDRLVESELGEIPEGWESAPASKLIEFNPPESLRKGTEAPYIEMAALPTIGSWPEPPVLRPFGSGMRFRNGDTLLARITPCLENGKTAFIQCLPENTVGWGSTEFIVMRPKPPLPPEFGYLLARDVAFREQAIRSMTGTSGRQRVQAGSLAAFKIAVPSNNDAWSAFSSIVTPAFKSIKANAETAATLAHFRDTLLLKLISGELRIKDAERFLQERGL